MPDIHGSVADNFSNKPLPGIVVTLVTNGTGAPIAGLTATTGSDGKFAILNSPYIDGDNSVFFTIDDPSGKYLPSYYPYSGLGNIQAGTDPSTVDKIPTIVIVLVVLALVAAGYFFLIKKR